ncbi:hypothetical protein Mp_1g14770 [Marchantia polymorpha subsp. ruderalis]|uniref:Uncharacterized protein n=2 Tax=Marchantia polymorpha TaxID=3197 RepID=A0AAF6AQ85_MARPO|nr:hypothetical protein MARPO_0153s0013 [Marchantia polymorpha]BBM98605.1 hypothetical protein Mp_1g14770 [Marchantia polymorpha subsp. ruderalis]|eukprot:PTQ28845.1 hypothetical protein MARPO_0153s0013 [Marchantia polymorpha]
MTDLDPFAFPRPVYLCVNLRLACVGARARSRTHQLSLALCKQVSLGSQAWRGTLRWNQQEESRGRCEVMELEKCKANEEEEGEEEEEEGRRHHQAPGEEKAPARQSLQRAAREGRGGNESAAQEEGGRSSGTQDSQRPAQASDGRNRSSPGWPGLRGAGRGGAGLPSHTTPSPTGRSSVQARTQRRCARDGGAAPAAVFFLVLRSTAPDCAALHWPRRPEAGDDRRRGGRGRGGGGGGGGCPERPSRPVPWPRPTRGARSAIE